MRNLAIITARSGSKGLKDKNILSLNGKPLLAYSIEVAKDSMVFDEIMCSTDSDEYATIAKKFGASVPFLRSSENSSDSAGSLDVVREVLLEYMRRGMTFDTVCILQPTSPLRTAEDIRNGYKLKSEKNAKTIVGVCETEHSPLWANTLPESLMMDDFFAKGIPFTRQKMQTYYRVNGALYIIDTESVLHGETIYNSSYAYIMPQIRSIDIDSEVDFLIAETLMKRQGCITKGN